MFGIEDENIVFKVRICQNKSKSFYRFKFYIPSENFYKYLLNINYR